MDLDKGEFRDWKQHAAAAAAAATFYSSSSVHTYTYTRALCCTTFIFAGEGGGVVQWLAAGCLATRNETGGGSAVALLTICLTAATIPHY